MDSDISKTLHKTSSFSKLTCRNSCLLLVKHSHVSQKISDFSTQELRIRQGNYATNISTMVLSTLHLLNLGLTCILPQILKIAKTRQIETAEV